MTVSAGLAVAGLIAVVGTAVAADMTGDEIKATISGKTVYLECGATSTGGQGQGVIYYAADGNALYKSAGRGLLHGTWASRIIRRVPIGRRCPAIRAAATTSRVTQLL
jgi:hypothetical protein